MTAKRDHCVGMKNPVSVVTDRVLCGPLLVCYLDGDANYVFWVCFFVVGGEWVVSVLNVFEVFKWAVLTV